MATLNPIHPENYIRHHSPATEPRKDISKWFKTESLELNFGEYVGRPSENILLHKEYLTRFLENGWTVDAVISSGEGGNWTRVTSGTETEYGHSSGSESSNSNSSHSGNNSTTSSGTGSSITNESSGTTTSSSNSRNSATTQTSTDNQNESSTSSADSSSSASSSNNSTTTSTTAGSSSYSTTTGEGGTSRSDQSTETSTSSTIGGSTNNNSSSSDTSNSGNSQKTYNYSSKESSTEKSNTSSNTSRNSTTNTSSNNNSSGSDSYSDRQNASKSTGTNSASETSSEQRAEGETYWYAYQRVRLVRRRMQPEYVLQEMVTSFTNEYNSGRSIENSRYEELVSLYATTLSHTETEANALISNAMNLNPLFDKVVESVSISLTAAHNRTVSMGTDIEQSSIDEINRRFDALKSEQMANMISNGMFNNTIWASVDAGIERQRASALAKSRADSSQIVVNSYANIAQVKGSVWSSLLAARQSMSDALDKRRITATEVRNNVLKWMADCIGSKEEDYPQLQEIAQLTERLGFSVGAAGNVL